MQADSQRYLLNAMTDHFPIKRSEIGPRTVPSQPPIGADSQGWGICLASFGEYLRELRPVYIFYVHKPRYTVETIDQPFSDTVLYLKQKALAQFGYFRLSPQKGKIREKIYERKNTIKLCVFL